MNLCINCITQNAKLIQVASSQIYQFSPHFTYMYTRFIGYSRQNGGCNEIGIGEMEVHELHPGGPVRGTTRW
jgi:hypothetical protein